MKQIFTLPTIFACTLMGLISAHAAEVLIHRGPTVSTPQAELYSPLHSGATAPEAGTRTEVDITLIKEFYADEATVARLPEPVTSDERLSAIQAIERATATVERGRSSHPLNVTRLEFLTCKITGGKEIAYYLIEMTTGGSIEHRVVLLDGTVLSPRLEKAKES